MPHEIRPITLSLPFRLGSVNCFLVTTNTGFILFDTGGSNKRAELREELERAGCEPGDLSLIVLTHGDFDHSGNAAYLRQQYGAPIAMHADDLGMVERGDMSWNRQSSRLVLRMTSALFGFGKAERFTPDLYLAEGDDLSAYGLDAKILHLPGHSRGSIGILLASSELIGGDLLDNTKAPAFNAIMDDREAAAASVEKLKQFEIKVVYPGHGRSFPMDEFMAGQ